MKKILLILALTIAAPFIFYYTVPTTSHAQEKILWIDVRTKAEYDTGHLEGAVLAPYDKIDKRIGKLATHKYKRISLYSLSGRRASIAKRTLKELGYSNVTNRGSYQALKAGK